VLQAGFATTAAGALGGDAAAQAEKRSASRTNPARVIDTHAQGRSRVSEIADGRLLGWSQLIQQLADFRRTQGVLAVTIDAPIFATPHSPYEREGQGPVAFRADRGL
jgi:hypothetical protein